MLGELTAGERTVVQESGVNYGLRDQTTHYRVRCVYICRQSGGGARAIIETEGARGRGNVKKRSHGGNEEESMGLRIQVD